MPPIMPAGSCPLRSESHLISSTQRNDAKCHRRQHYKNFIFKSLFLPTCRCSFEIILRVHSSLATFLPRGHDFEEASVMNRSARFVIVVVPLLSMFMAMSLSALAEEPRRPPAERRAAVVRHDHRRFDPHHFDHRLWALGRAYPHGCRWGRCGYWWWADGYWYFYDHPLNGPPEVVSDVAYDEQGNVVPVAYAWGAGASGNAATTPARRDGTTTPIGSDGATAATTPTAGAKSGGGRDRRRHGRRYCRRRAGPRAGRLCWRCNWRHDWRRRRCGSAGAAGRLLLVARRLLLSLSEWRLVAANGSALLRLLN